MMFIFNWEKIMICIFNWGKKLMMSIFNWEKTNDVHI